jgi:hypothetical protein
MNLSPYALSPHIFTQHTIGFIDNIVFGLELYMKILQTVVGYNL